MECGNAKQVTYFAIFLLLLTVLNPHALPKLVPCALRGTVSVGRVKMDFFITCSLLEVFTLFLVLNSSSSSEYDLSTYEFHFARLPQPF